MSACSAGVMAHGLLVGPLGRVMDSHGVHDYVRRLFDCTSFLSGDVRAEGLLLSAQIARVM